MRKLLLFVAVLSLAGCGSRAAEVPLPAADSHAPAVLPKRADADAKDNPWAGYSDGVKAYYGDAPMLSTGDIDTDTEIEYFQPPDPAETALGKPIELTGTNIGIRLKVRVTRVRSGAAGTTVELALQNTGIAVYEGPLRNAVLTLADGSVVEADGAAQGRCTLPAGVRIDVGDRSRGCLRFAVDADAAPARLQLALEEVPADAGGIWDLTAR